MAVEKIRRPYELLIRWRNGVVHGAHLQYEKLVIVDGEVLSHEIDNDLEPIDVNTLVTYPVLGEDRVNFVAKTVTENTEAASLKIRAERAEALVKQFLNEEAGRHLKGGNIPMMGKV